MANLNLSEFTEKLFVADADHTFIWDSAASISKRVSRNSWLNSGTLTSDAPVTISQMWNQIGTAFTAFKVNAVSTASASGSLLLDLQVGGVSRSKVDKGGFITAAGVFVNVVGKAISNPAGQELGFGYTNNGCAFYRYSTTIASFVNSASVGGNSSGLNLGTDALGFASSAEGALSVVLLRDGADNTLALRNGALAQTFNVYGTYTSAASYARLAIACDTSGNATLTTQSTGVAGTVSINGVPVGLGSGNVSTNVAIGAGAMIANTSGSRNTFIGKDSGASNTTGLANVAVGNNALKLNTSSITNTAVGDSALDNISVTGGNTAIGQGAGSRYTGSQLLTSSSSSIFIGTSSSALANFSSNEIVIGSGATGIGSNSVVLGNDSITKTALKGNVGIGTTSPTSKLHVAETWNNAGTAFCAIKSVITDTNSAAGSDFLELYSGTSTQPLRMDINKTGQINAYGTWTDAGNYERLAFNPADATFSAGPSITTQQAGSGVSRQLNIGTTGTADLRLATNSLWRWRVGGSTGHLLAHDDNTYDIGASSANRPKNLYLSGFAVVGSSLSVGGDLTVGDTKLLGWISGRSIMSSPADGYIRFTDSFQTNFNRLQFGGTSASFPALKRVGTDLQVVVANTTAAIGVAAGDADLTFIEDRYRRKGAGTPEGVVTAPIGAVYHNTTGGAGTSFYVKESGTGNTGWVGK